MNKIKRTARVILEGVKDVAKMTPKQLQQEKEIRKLGKEDPRWHKDFLAIRKMKYEQRLINQDLEKTYGSKNKNKERGTASSSQRKPAK
jgi:hypothetical protein